MLRDKGIEFVQKSSPFDEDTVQANSPKEFVYKATVGKMDAFKHDPKDTVLCADTVVTSSGKILRKAKDIYDARAILQTQSNTQTSIITCSYIKSPNFTFIDISSTDYSFSEFDDKDLDKYLDSGEWIGKAGACMVEGFCEKYIIKVRGAQSCAMGLSMEKILPFIS